MDKKLRDLRIDRPGTRMAIIDDADKVIYLANMVPYFESVIVSIHPYSVDAINPSLNDLLILLKNHALHDTQYSSGDLGPFKRFRAMKVYMGHRVHFRGKKKTYLWPVNREFTKFHMGYTVVVITPEMETKFCEEADTYIREKSPKAFSCMARYSRYYGG